MKYNIKWPYMGREDEAGPTSLHGGGVGFPARMGPSPSFASIHERQLGLPGLTPWLWEGIVDKTSHERPLEETERPR